MSRFIARQTQWRILIRNTEYTSSLYYICRKFEENLRPNLLFSEALFHRGKTQVLELGERDMREGEEAYVKQELKRIASQGIVVAAS